MPTSRLLIVMILKVGQLDYVTTDLFWMEIAAHVKWSYFCLWYLGCLTDHHHNIVVICIVLWSLFWKAGCYSWSWIHECASLACPTARKCLIKYPLWERSASLILNYVKSIIKDISPFWGDNCFRQFQSPPCRRVAFLQVEIAEELKRAFCLHQSEEIEFILSVGGNWVGVVAKSFVADWRPKHGKDVKLCSEC